MKKLLLFVIACTLGLFGAVNAQETITIGNGTDNAYNLCDGFAGYGASQQIYTAEEIANAGGSVGTITSLAFKKERGTDYDRTWSIYLKNIDETVFTNLGESYNPYSYIYTMSSDDLVYEGTFRTSNDWVTFDIKPFEYDGRNLLVTVVQNSGIGGADQFWRYTTNTDYSTNQCLAKYAEKELDVTQKLNWNMFAGRFDIQLTIAAEEGGGEEPEPTPEPEQPGNDLIVTVGSGSEVEAFVPFNTSYDNTISQQIYLAEDFQGKTGKIKSYAFKCAIELSSYGTPITVTRDFKVYMINTDKSSFTSVSDWAAVTESDLVFDGSVTFQPKDEWTVVTFYTPFEYEEGKNVLICINDASAWVNGSMKYYSHVTENVRSLVSYVDKTPYDATAITVESKFDNLNYVAQAQFEFVSEGGGETPTPEPEQPGGEELASEFSFDFEDGTLDGWRVFQGQYATGDNWQLADGKGKEGSKGIYSASTILLEFGSAEYTPRNYVVTTDAYAITETSELSWWMGDESVYYEPTNDAYQVVISEDGTTFTPIWSGDGDGANENTISLAEYAGKTLYLGFYHYIPGSYGDGEIRLDNIVLSAGEGGGETPTPEPEEPTPADIVYRLESITYPYSWDNLSYVYESETSDKVLQVLVGTDDYGQYATVINYDENGVITGTEYKWRNSDGTLTSSNWIRNFEYTYTDGILTSYIESDYYDYQEPNSTIYTLARDTEGNVTEVASETSKVVYAYENDKLVGEIKYYYDVNAETPDFVVEYEVEYAYDENGNCVSATQYQWNDTVKVASKCTEYFYDLTVTEDVYTFAYPHEVKPATANVLVATLSYEYYPDYNTGELQKSNFGVKTYNYNIEVEEVHFPPMGLNAVTLDASQIFLSWSTMEDAEKFYVYANGEFMAERTDTYYYAEGLDPYTEYCFTVVAVNGELELESEPVCAKTLDLGIVAPVVTAEATETTVTLTWNVVENALSYKVYQGEDTIANITATTYTVEGLTAETTYSFTVSAVRNEQEVKSEVVEVSTLAEPAAPAIPTNVAAVAGLNNVMISWDAVEGATYYVIYKDGVAFESSSKTKYVVRNLEIGKEYSFAVKAGADLESELSDAVLVTTGVVEEDEVVTGTPTAKYYAPFFTNMGSDNWTEIIYTAEELGNKACAINEIAFLFNDSNNYDADITADNIDIYFAETEKTAFADGNDAMAEGELKLVYSGTAVTLCDTPWETFELNAPFNYSGKKNLAVVVRAKSSKVASNWQIYQDAENTVLLKGMTVFNKKPVAKFAISEPVAPTAKAYRLESVADGFSAKSYVYDEELTNRVVAVEEDFVPTVISYNEAGQIASAIVYAEELDSVGNPIEFSSTRYTYNEDGVWVGYTEVAYGWMGLETTEATLNYNENGQLVSLVTSELIQEVTYNEAGLIAEVVTSRVVVEGEEEGEGGFDDGGVVPVSEEENEEDAEEGTEEETVMYTDKKVFEYDAEGRLVKKSTYFYYGEFVLGEVEVYEYDENGNCVSMETYEADEETGELREYPWMVDQYFYDLTINNEDVYSFDYPHLAFINWVEPSHVNILTKVLNYTQFYNDEIGSMEMGACDVKVYNYNPEVLSLPLAPMNVTTEVTSAETIELSWAGFADAETFTIYSADTVYAEGLVDPYYTIEGLEMNVDYCFTVQAVNEVGVSEVSAPACAKIELPAAPANLVAEATSDTTIALTWDEVPGISEYNVYKVVDTTYEFVGAAWWINYTVEGLTAETEYSFVVKSVNNVGESLASNVATATTLKAEEDEPVVPEPVVPAAPVVAVDTVTETTVVLTWAAVEGALSYNVYQGADSIANVTDTTFTVTGLTANTEYSFTVTAVNEAGESEASNVATATTLKGEGIAENAAAFNIYPNPATDRVVIETEATIESVTIYSITGVMVYSEVDFNNNTINVSDLASGVYFVKVRTDNGEAVQRFIKK